MFEMIVDSEIRHLSVPKRFAVYARAYRSAAAALCQQMVQDESAHNWPNSAVVLMLAAHAVELFLKGAIHYRDPNANVEHHRIDALAKEYTKRFPESLFAWDIPFKVEYLGLTETEIKAVERTTPAPSILYRYPVAQGKREWNGALGFVPSTFLPVLERMQHDFERIESQLT